MNVSKAFLVFLTLLGCTSCVQPVGFQSSGIETPEAWHTFERLPGDPMLWDNPLVVDDCAEVEQRWWHHFDDCVLDTLITRALLNNKTLGIASTRIEEARAARLGAFSVLMPQINLNTDAQRGNQGLFTGDRPLAYEDVNIQANWELDLFGKNQARMAATIALVQNEEILRQGVIVSLLAEVARGYYDFRNYQDQITISEKNLETQKRTLELTIAQFQEAYASDFDVQRAAAQVASTEARIPTLKIALETTRNRLDVLLGSTPGENDDLFATYEPLMPLDPQIIIAAPATVLGTRPDVRAAERELAASISTFEAAKKEWFPTISLAAFFGFQALQGFNQETTGLQHLIRTWNVAGTLVQPLIDFGRIEADIETADARQQRAFLEYQETVLEAFENMENALANYLYETIRNVSLTSAATHNHKALELANQQYTNGYTNLLDVLVVQRNALEAESAAAESTYKLRKDLVNIYTAAGGGWAL
ncbi:MAG: TolC family protein [Parachlamydiales bacterium]|jgi:multidrug efflux system outer membrane protein